VQVNLLLLLLLLLLSGHQLSGLTLTSTGSSVTGRVEAYSVLPWLSGEHMFQQ
jgi:hypothetical protein